MWVGVGLNNVGRSVIRKFFRESGMKSVSSNALILRRTKLTCWSLLTFAESLPLE